MVTCLILTYFLLISCYLDTDECELGLDKCAFQATCTNVEGWYTCECLEGYSGDGYVCKKGMK